ncbi:MAG: hypothetical protein U0793_10350 [Gemmataceae bacterium]
MNALADDKVAEIINDSFTATYLKVGTFKIVGGAKVGGNVASYFCEPDGTVIHAIAGKVDAATLIREARYALDLHKSALTNATDLASGKVNLMKQKAFVRKAHTDRYFDEITGVRGGAPAVGAARLRAMPGAVAGGVPRMLPAGLPAGVAQQAQTEWLLATQPLAKMDAIYPIVWQNILREKLSTLPVAKR